MSAAELVAKLAADGTDPQLLAAVAESLFKGEAAQAAIDAKKEQARARQAAKRERDASRDVTECHVTERDVTDKKDLDKKTPHTPQKINPKNNPPISPQNQIVSGWNEMAEKHGLPRVAKLTDERKRALKARLREHSVEEILTAIGEVPRNKHWMGEAGWKGNFTTFCRPGHITSFLEAAAANGPATLSVPQRIESYESAAKLYDRMGREDDAAEARRKAEELRKAA